MSLFAKKAIPMAGRNLLYRMARERFVEPELRAKEEALLKSATASLRDDAEQVQKDLPVLRRYLRTATISVVHFNANGLKVEGPLEDREFELPNGDKVVRQSKASRTLDGLTIVPNIDTTNVQRFLSAAGIDFARGPSVKIPIGGAFEVPCNHATTIYVHGYNGEHLIAEENAWISKRSLVSVKFYLDALETRVRAEFDLLRAMCKLIRGSKTWGEMVEVWPEAKEFEDQVFGDAPIPKSRSLAVVLQDHERAALCRNMAGRGVAAPLCEPVAEAA